ncbi:MAG: hypothetical protein IK117_00405 [Bacteroidales bacterium]|nr:hypothetical protein [Bacteroidales bacterium]
MISQNQSNDGCPLGMFVCNTLVLLFISAWASALLVSTNRAMREPQAVGRVTDTDSTLFYF